MNDMLSVPLINDESNIPNYGLLLMSRYLLDIQSEQLYGVPFSMLTDKQKFFYLWDICAHRNRNGDMPNCIGYDALQVGFMIIAERFMGKNIKKADMTLEEVYAIASFLCELDVTNWWAYRSSQY